MLQFFFQYMITVKRVEIADMNDIPAKQIKNHKTPIESHELLSYDFEFFFPCFENVLSLVIEGLAKISKRNPMRYLWFWHIKNAEEDKVWDEDNIESDTYDRQDNYNVVGLVVLMALMEKKNAFCLNKSLKELSGVT